jgi:hypothetical protein
MKKSTQHIAVEEMNERIGQHFVAGFGMHMKHLKQK